MPRGVIKKVFEDREYGFIQPDDGSRHVWFHREKVEPPLEFSRLEAGTPVDYLARLGRNGPQATRVRAVAPSRAPDQPRPAAQVRTEARTGYRFYNPYNFVRFLIPPDENRVAEQARNEPDRSADFALLGRRLPPPHDRYVGLSGSIECTLEAVTPLFIAGAEDLWPQGEHQSLSFFKLGNDPAIPSTSLRGMVRSIFEAVTGSCVSQLADRTLSYHLPPADALKLVPARVEKDEATGAWSLRLLTGDTRFVPGQRPQGCQYSAWVPLYLDRMIRRSFNARDRNTPYGRRPVVNLGGRTHKDRCWALLARHRHPRRNFEFSNVERLDDDPATLETVRHAEDRLDYIIAEGYLCLNNQNIENKHDERFFFFAGPLAAAQVIPLEKTVRDAYKTLIQDYQERHAKAVSQRKQPDLPDRDHPAFSRFIVDRDHHAADLGDGDLVYAQITSQDKVDYIVPVSVPRVSYRRSIANLLPGANAQEDSPLCACHRHDQLCPACRVFGWVRQADPGKEPSPRERVAHRGRVAFSHGTVDPQKKTGTMPIVPLAILSSPKPTTVRFYLMPSRGVVPQRWEGTEVEQGYDSQGLKLRGRKMYRHHGKARPEEYTRAGDRCDDQNRTVRDALLPGSTFKFTVRFENLASVELGALLWALTLGDRGFHRLGMARPLGFGSVKVQVNQVQVIDPGSRYTGLQEDGVAAIQDWHPRFVEPYQIALAKLHDAPGFEDLPPVVDLRVLLAEPADGLPVHYPRTGYRPDAEGKNFEWFQGNTRQYKAALRNPAEDDGLPLLSREGREQP